jgi:hypothetical protein
VLVEGTKASEHTSLTVVHGLVRRALLRVSAASLLRSASRKVARFNRLACSSLTTLAAAVCPSRARGRYASRW